MATAKAIRPAKRVGLNATPSMVRKEAASQTFVKGALLRYNGSGYVEECAADALGIIGIADEAGQNGIAGQYTVGFTPVGPNVIFEATIDASNAGTGTTAQSQVGVQYGLTKNASGIWTVDTDKTDPAVVRCVVEALKDDVDVTLGRVYIRFLQ